MDRLLDLDAALILHKIQPEKLGKGRRHQVLCPSDRDSSIYLELRQFICLRAERLQVQE